MLPEVNGSRFGSGYGGEAVFFLDETLEVALHVHAAQETFQGRHHRHV
jgi:hypothetical protein